MTTSCNEIHAQIGDVKIGREGDVLHALLGSCIGIGFLHRDEGIYGLAHCLLSKAPKITNDISGRHVDQAIHSLIKLLRVTPENRRRVHVFIAGGGNMTMSPDAPGERLVGNVNSEFAKKTLRKYRLRLLHEDVGGCNARKVTIDCTTGDFTIKTIPRIGVQ